MNIQGLDTVLANLSEVQGWMLKVTIDAGDEIGHLLANYAKGHHLWRPITGHTDTSTVGGVEEVAMEYVLIALSAGMDYDVFLELARQGKWAWLMPAVEANKDNIMQIWERHLQTVFI